MDPDPLSFQYINLQAFVPVLSDYILTALLLLFIISNAIISGSEVAFFTVERNFSDDIHTSDEPKKISISNLLRKPEKLSASIVIAYNLLNVSITVLIIYLLNRLPFFGGDVVETLLLEVIISICVVLLFVNILPKLYASHNPLRFASNNVYFIYFINRLMSPASSLR